MTNGEVREGLWMIARMNPRLAGLLAKPMGRVGKQRTLFDNWAEVLRDLDEKHYFDVCEEYAGGRRRIDDENNLVFEIATECRNRTYREQQRLEQYSKVHRLGRAPWREAKPEALWCRIIKYVLSHKQPPDHLEDLVRWEKGAPKPDWLEASETD